MEHRPSELKSSPLSKTGNKQKLFADVQRRRLPLSTQTLGDKNRENLFDKNTMLVQRETGDVFPF
jgi:hypothetical protein